MHALTGPASNAVRRTLDYQITRDAHNTEIRNKTLTNKTNQDKRIPVYRFVGQAETAKLHFFGF